MAGKLRRLRGRRDDALSVNLPLGRSCRAQAGSPPPRWSLHRNEPGVLARINGLLAQHGLNIEQQVLSTTGAVGFAVTDVPGAVTPRRRRRAAAEPETIRAEVVLPCPAGPAASAAYPRAVPDAADLPLIGAAARGASRGPGPAHAAHRHQGRRAGRDGRRAGGAHRRDSRRQRRSTCPRPPQTGTPAAILDRLRAGRRSASPGWPTPCGALIALPDPVGDIVRGSTLPNGLQLRQVRVPLGVVGIVYEARPNVTVDAAGLCLKSGNAALLRGLGLGVRHQLRAGRRPHRDRGEGRAARPARSQLLPADRASVGELLNARGLVDVVIPRGGAALIERVVRESTVPVIETGVGNCHVYVDASADPAMAEAIVLNAKTYRVSVCNAAETLLVHRDVPFRPAPRCPAPTPGVTLHGDPAARAAHPVVVPATDEDWATEYLSMDMAVGSWTTCRRRWSTSRTGRAGTARRSSPTPHRAIADFTAGVDAAAVLVNASTRFTDGGEFGFGAEIGITTREAARPRAARPAGADLHDLRGRPASGHVR